MPFNYENRAILTSIISAPGNGIITVNALRDKFKARNGDYPCKIKDLLKAINSYKWPGVILAEGRTKRGSSGVFAVWTDSIISLVNGQKSVSLNGVRLLYQKAYNKTIPLYDNSLENILMSANISIKPPEFSVTAILRDKFVPQTLQQINRYTTALQWDASRQQNMDQVISMLAADFIPRTSAVLGIKNGHKLYEPNLPFQMAPNLRFALQSTVVDALPSKIADLDETDSIKEYVDSFHQTVKLEYEEQMRLYEHYSLYNHRVKPMTKNTVGIDVPGIMAARPSLSIGDIVLLRPIQPVMVLQYNNYHNFVQPVPNTLEIVSHIVDLIRGRNGKPDSIVISWELDEKQKDLLNDHQFLREYCIRFVPSDSFPRKVHTALDWLNGLSQPQQQNLKYLLFPVVAPMVKPLRHDQQSCEMSGIAGNSRSSDILKPLNETQASFVRMIRARTLDPSFEHPRPACILTGPAGTGKTKTLIATIADVLGLLKQEKTNKNRVLLCAPSHAAADVLTERLTALLRRDEIFRMFDSTRPSTVVPGKILPFTIQIPGSDTFTLPPPEVWARFRVVVCTCIDTHILYRAQLTNYAIRTKRQHFISYLQSVNPTGLNLGENDVSCNKEPFFTHLFIDEAGQATEPEILCPMSVVLDPLPGEQKAEIALIGDPRQLSPMIYSERAASHGHGRSFMERILKRPVECIGRGQSHILGPDTINDLDGPGSSLLGLIRYYANIDGHEQLTIFLTENYRGHPSFLMMPSALFYYDRLRSAKKLDSESLSYWIEKLRAVESLSGRVEMPVDQSVPCEDLMRTYRQVHHQTKWPIHFRAVKGKDTSSSLESFTGTDSWQNTDEADAAVEIVDTLVQNGVAESKIGVMSPFRGQVVAIRKRCREKHYHDVNVGTIENFQGVEQDVIILSLTRSNPAFVANDIKRRMGVFHMPKKSNVALTRAENLFIVIGNPEPMWEDELWRQWLLFCLRNGLWYGKGLEECVDVKDTFRDAKFVPMLEQVDEEDDGDVVGAIVVSTIEKIHRVHSTNEDKY